MRPFMIWKLKFLPCEWINSNKTVIENAVDISRIGRMIHSANGKAFFLLFPYITQHAYRYIDCLKIFKSNILIESIGKWTPCKLTSTYHPSFFLPCKVSKKFIRIIIYGYTNG